MYLNLILADAAPAAAPGQQSLLGSPIIFLILMAVIFYFFLIRPQKKREKELKAMREAITAGTSVVTSGGIHGKVKEVKDNVLVIEIANNVNITIDKTSVFVESAAADNSQK
ncbi:MAG: preprotein translocase subunit YajC [Paludibacteraceae bacterium]|nr:preprotein translocase subunit YajC [Paludibacteraceae bacterium]